MNASLDIRVKRDFVRLVDTSGFVFALPRPTEDILNQVPFPKPDARCTARQSQSLVMFQKSQSLPLHVPDYFNEEYPEPGIGAPQHKTWFKAVRVRIRAAQHHEPESHTRNRKHDPPGRVSSDEGADENSKDADESYRPLRAPYQQSSGKRANRQQHRSPVLENLQAQVSRAWTQKSRAGQVGGHKRPVMELRGGEVLTRMTA